jgi:hypothetical protein
MNGIFEVGLGFEVNGHGQKLLLGEYQDGRAWPAHPSPIVTDSFRDGAPEAQTS